MRSTTCVEQAPVLEASNGHDEQEATSDPSPHPETEQAVDARLLDKSQTVQNDLPAFATFNLPREIRDMIWKELVGDRCIHIYHCTANYQTKLSHRVCGAPEKCRDSYLSRKAGHCAYISENTLVPEEIKEPTQTVEVYQDSGHRTSRRQNTAPLPVNIFNLLKVNGQVRTEVLEILYSTSTFSFGTGHSLQRFLDRVSVTHLAKIKVIDLKIEHSHARSAYRYQRAYYTERLLQLDGWVKAFKGGDIGYLRGLQLLRFCAYGLWSWALHRQAWPMADHMVKRLIEGFEKDVISLMKLPRATIDLRIKELSKARVNSAYHLMKSMWTDSRLWTRREVDEENVTDFVVLVDASQDRPGASKR